MPPLTLTWDLFIVVFFAVVMSYCFLIGKDRTTKLIVGSYIAIIATLGIGDLLVRLIGNGEIVFQTVGIPLDITLLSLSKIFVFAVCILIFASKSGIELTHGKDTGTILTILYTALFGFSLSGLILSTVLTYILGSSILGGTVIGSTVLTPLIESSPLLQLFTVNQDLWFTFPAFLIIAVGLMHRE